MGGLFSKKVGKKGILVLGLDNAGKTTTFQQLISGFDLSAEDIETAPTIGQNIDVTTYKNIKFNVVDMGGSSDSRGLWQDNFDEAHAVIFIIDSSDPDRLEESKNEIHKLLAEPMLSKCVFLFLANKQDVSGAVPPEEIEEFLELHMADQVNSLFGISATNAEGLEVAMTWLSKRLKEQKK
eukprot:TRINITY_DN3368_c0_g1_i1.p1 TRINITY_DN3368_c0_g1~~TRINITY_DN3368_c0_g1_i1.p1  ORF type:complete len:181 (-),score=42.71 TRINITY_DN3368_c0_g1_i1:346-888(-)